MQKSCKWILICGSACICSLVFQVVLHCTIFLFQKSFKQILFSFVSEHISDNSTGWFWANFSANHPDSGWLAHIRQHNLCCTLLKEMACKRSSWVSHKMGENVAFCLFEDSKSNFVTRRLHSHSIWVFSLDSVERNGEQKAFLGKLQKEETSCFVWIYEDSTSNFINRKLHKFDTINSRICSKSCFICSVSCFRERSHFLSEIKPSELASRESRGELISHCFAQAHLVEALQESLKIKK